MRRFLTGLLIVAALGAAALWYFSTPDIPRADLEKKYASPLTHFVTLAGNAAVNRQITSIYSSWDPIIPNGSVLDGATNIELPVTGHFRILDRPELLAAVERAVSVR